MRSSKPAITPSNYVRSNHCILTVTGELDSFIYSKMHRGDSVWYLTIFCLLHRDKISRTEGLTIQEHMGSISQEMGKATCNRETRLINYFDHETTMFLPSCFFNQSCYALNKESRKIPYHIDTDACTIHSKMT